MNVKNEAQSLHNKALQICREIRQDEWRLIEVLQKIDRIKGYKYFGSASLFQYAISHLGLSEAQAYSYISVARKAREVQELELALRGQTLSVSKSSRLVSALTMENAAQ